MTAEIMNWTGHVVAAPRSDLRALLKRPEATRTGIYILLGDDPDSLGGQKAYIGEGDDVSKRLYQHARSEDQNGKDFWDRAIVLTSKDTNLTKAHARYLESRLITLALKASRAKLTNGTAPPPTVLPEADVSDMEYFIEQAKIVLPVLGINIFRSPKATTITPNQELVDARTDSPLFEMTLKKSRITATAQEIDGEFTVLEDSGARLKWIGGEGHSYTGLRTKLEQDGTLVPESNGLAMRFTRNHVFASPSAAAAIVAGRSANGRVEWTVHGTRRTYGQWESEGVEEAMQWGGKDE
ncbi:MAG: GIY-YIG nuclease family protein [Mycobacterium sp.]